MDSAPRNNPPISGRVPAREPKSGHPGGMKYPKCAGVKTMPCMGGDTKFGDVQGDRNAMGNNMTEGKIEVTRPKGKVRTGKAT